MTCEQVNERLLDYVEGQLPADEARQVRAHLDRCPACAARCRQTGQLLAELSAARAADGEQGELDARRVSPPAAAGGTGRRIIGDFELLEQIGRGGMGTVYRARQRSLNRIVALKVLAAGLPQSQRVVARFRKEAQAAARLHHTNIVPIYAQGQHGGHYFYAMELIDGQALDRVLLRDPLRLRLPEQAAPTDGSGAQEPAAGAGRTAAGRLRSSISSLIQRAGPAPGERQAEDYKRIARLIAEVAEALHHAHQQGIIHRDIKPQNLLLGRDDRLHITDFGLARLLDEPGLTLSTELVGTPAYMAPEQITGGRRAVDRRTDVYALGVTLYELLTLRRPFTGQTYDQVIAQVLRRQPRPPRRIDPDIPLDLDTICARAMEKEPRRRLATAAELAGELRRYAADFPIVSRRVGPLGKSIRWVRRHPARAGMLAAVGLIVLLVPLSLSLGRAYAQQQLENAWQTLLADYRDGQQALARLGWSARALGQRYRLEMVRALAHIRTQPEQTARLARAILGRRPGDRDAHALLAWAYRRRMQHEGDAMWTRAREHIRQARAPGGEPTAAGYFFLAQALWGTDPKQAQRVFDQAIDACPRPFYQAMLHQARAMNQIMYFLREVEYYEKAVSRLESVCSTERRKAYPRYLLSITHLLAAEIYADRGERDKAAAAYRRSLAAAQAAQAVEPTSPRGYAAEAGCRESQGDLRGALRAWNRLEQHQVVMSRSDAMERQAYAMRLYFWLGDYDSAERMRAARYREQRQPGRGAAYDPDATFYEALLAASAGDRARAAQALAAGLRRAGGDAEPLLLLDATCRLLGVKPEGSGLWRAELDYARRRPPGWTPAWLRALVRYQRGELGWAALEAAARQQAHGAEDRRLRMAGAHFFRGLRELAAGRRDRALGALTESWHQYDNENYCFRAKLIALKLERDPGWPAWLP